MLTSISCVTLNSVGLSAKWVLSDSLQHCLKLEFVVLYPVHENPCLIYHAYAKEYNNLSEYHVYRNNWNCLLFYPFFFLLRKKFTYWKGRVIMIKSLKSWINTGTWHDQGKYNAQLKLNSQITNTASSSALLLSHNG